MDLDCNIVEHVDFQPKETCAVNLYVHLCRESGGHYFYLALDGLS